MDDFDYKSLTKKELQHIFSDVDFPLEPMQHQYVSLAFSADKHRVSLCLDVGTGKTLCALYLAKLWGCKKILVVCPSSAFGSWRRDLRYNTDFSYSFLTGSGRQKKQKAKKKQEVYIITYEGLKTLYAKLFRGEGYRIQSSYFIHNFDCVVLDEDHRCNSYDALQSEICYQLSKRAKYLIGMTGTLIDKSYIELFGIYRAIDLGESLGINFFAYRNRFFDKVVCGSKYGRKWIEWELKPGSEKKILDLISSNTLCYEIDECFDLPKVYPIVKYILPSKEFLSIQKDVIENKVLQLPEVDVPVGKIKAKSHVLRELPSGFLYYGKDKQTFRLKENPKIDALLDMLEDSNSKMVVFYWYTEERAIIVKALKKEKISFCSAYGGQDLDDREKEIARFSKDEKVRLLLSQITVAREGFDAFVANIVIFFSPLGSPRRRKQCIGRIRRKGQDKKCLAVDFVIEGSLEERVVENRGPRFNFVRETMAYIQDFHSSKESEI